MSLDLDDADAVPTSKRVAVWACPEVPGPTLDRRDVVDGCNRNLSFGWTWWSARHIVLLPEGMTLPEAWLSSDPVPVTVWADVSPLVNGLNEIHQRFNTDWSATKPEDLRLDPNDLLAVVEPGYGDSFRLLRDIHRRQHNLPRAVVRSDNYSRQPHHMLVHDWPDGIFFQGGTTRRPGHEPGVFIEAFPRDPATFLRGEGPTYTDAENALWTRWERIVGCPSPTGDHEWETRGYRNGAGFCAHCGLFGSHVFDLAEIGSVCVVCGTGTYWTQVRRRAEDGTWLRDEPADLVCEEHAAPARFDLIQALAAHRDSPDTVPMPDLSWMAHRLPAGVPVTALRYAEFLDAYRHAERDRLDDLLAAQSAAQEPAQ